MLHKTFPRQPDIFYYTTDTDAEFSYLMSHDLNASKKVIEKSWI